MSTIARLRAAVRTNNYEYSQHALEEMDEDDLSDTDVREAILSGGIRTELTDDPRGLRYLVKGKSGNIDSEIIARFVTEDTVRIITVYTP
jgi:hypothetical protein